jgi:serine/threonine protein kinase/Tol biopolymer transport system component
MPSLRDEITKTLLRLGRKSGTGARAFTGDRRSTLASGTELGTYRIIEPLGEGGMGQVYLALDAHLNRKVALKVLPPELTGNAVFLRRFEQEARTASSLNHPNILTIFDFLEVGGHHIIVSEFVEGKTLRELITDDIDLGQTLDVVAQAASALSAAHAAGVVHRDLKPTNIMVRPDGWVKIIDFGLAKLTQAGGSDGGESWTLPGAVLGTVGYMSPEQARGDEIDARTDIWSMGVILYEILARCRPFEGASDSHVIVAILDETPRPIPDAEKLPAGLVAVVDRALAKEKKWRYQSMAEMAADLERVRGAMGSGTRRAPVPRRPSGARRTAISIATAALLLAAAMWWWPLGGRWRVLEPNWFEIGASRRLTFVGNVEVATISPDGHSVAYVSGSQGNEVLHLLDLRTNARRSLQPTPEHYLGIAFTADSRRVLYVAKDMQREMGKLFSIPTAEIGSEPPSVLLEDVDSGLAISGRGDRFAFRRGSARGTLEINQILVGPLNSPRSVKAVVTLDGTHVGEIAWSPADSWLGTVTYPARLDSATLPTVSLYRPSGELLRSFAPKAIRRLNGPVAIDGGALLLFAGMPRGAQQYEVVQLFLPTGQFRARQPDVVGVESLSATADGKQVAAVRSDERSSIWVADSKALGSLSRRTSDAEQITSVAWLGEEGLVFPSSRSGDVNLVQLDSSGKITPLSTPESCVQTQPATVPGGTAVVYSSNCASEGDDFTLWTVDARTGVRRRLTAGSNFDEQPTVSPDAKWVYYTSWSSNISSIWRVSVAGGTPARILQKQARKPVLSPDGRRFASIVREDDGRWVVEIASVADGTILKRLPEVPINTPMEWSPDGTAIDYAAEDSVSAGIWRCRLRGGAVPKLLLRVSEGTISSFAWNRSGTKIALVRARDERDAVLFTRASK